MSMDRWMDKEDVVHICNGIVLNHKKNKIMPFIATWMDLEIIILSEVSQTERQIYVEFKIPYKWTYLSNRNRPTDFVNLWLPKEGRKRD